MKSTVTEKPCEKKSKYPCLMLSGINGMVWLIYKSGCGTRITDKTEHTDVIGFFNDNLDMEDFKPFHGSVCLEND